MSLKKFSVIALFILIVLVVIDNTFKISSIILLHYKIYLLNAIGDKESIKLLSKEINGLSINSKQLFGAIMVFIFPFIRLVVELYKTTIEKITQFYISVISSMFVFVVFYGSFLLLSDYLKFDIFILIPILIMIQCLFYDSIAMLFGKLIDWSTIISIKLQKKLFGI